MLRREWPQWREHVTLEERAALETRVKADEWYSMATFEQLGLRILEHVVGHETDSIRLWGRGQVQTLLGFVPEIANVDDPRDSLMRFPNFFGTLFDFPALRVESVDDSDALICIDYGMSPRAEEAASWQAAGFFEELIAASGGHSVRIAFETTSWTGEASTRLRLTWNSKYTKSPTPFLVRPRVLLVEDEVLVARGITRLLGNRVELSIATRAAEALQLLETREFDTVLSDFNMPERDGLSLLEEAARRWPTLRRVLQSGSMPARAKAALAAGVVHQLIDKPATNEELLAAVSRKP
jgi:CheY-like chemotaxis protein